MYKDFIKSASANLQSLLQFIANHVINLVYFHLNKQL